MKAAEILDLPLESLDDDVYQLLRPGSHEFGLSLP
jgi:hypothetical protein